MSTRRYAYALGIFTAALFALSHVYVDQPYQKARTVFWTATGQYMDIAEEPVSQDWQPYNLSNVPIAQEEPAIADTIDVVQDKEEEQADFISMTMPDDEGESFDAFPPIPESISARSPTFHVLRPPRRIHDAIASCIEQCKRPRSARRHHLRPRQITSRVIDRAYGEEISFPFKGDFPYTLRNTSQFALQRIFDARLALLPSSSHTTLRQADFIYFNLDGEGLRSCEKCSASLGHHGFEERNLVQQWILETSTSLQGRRNYQSLLLVLPRIWHAYTANMLDQRIRTAFEEDGAVLNIEVGEIGHGRGEFWQVPYPTMFHLGAGQDEEVRDWILGQERKTLLTCSLGRLDTLNPESSVMRKAIAHQLSDLDRSDLSFTYHFDPQTAYVAMSESVFCLQPPGDSATRRGFFDSILLGCIPVIFASDTYKSFASLDIEEFAVVLSPEDAFSPNILDKLESITLEDIARRQEGLAKLAPRLQYALPGERGNDAFDGILGMLADLRDSA